MTAIGPHAQRGGSWINHISKLPNGAPVKAVNDYQLLWQVYDINPTLYTVFRKFWDGSQTYDDAPFEVKKQRAREYFDSFLDGTFDTNAHKVKAIGLWNEEYSASQSAIERARRVDQDTAFVVVWLEEYKTRYPHIHLHSTSAAPGNSIPLGIAALAHEFRNDLTYVLDYHAYTAVNGNAVVPGENVWCSCRWMQDDALYRQNGYYVKWFSGESGATGWSGQAFDYGGWKEPQVHGGNIQNYLDVTVNDNLTRWKAWNAANNGRFLGAVNFTSNNNADSRWKSYELLDEWGPMADYIRTHSGGTLPPPTNNDEAEIWQDSITRQIERGISLNNKAGLQSLIFANGGEFYTPVTREETFTASSGIVYGYMASEWVNGGRPRRVHYFVWPWSGPGNVKVISR